MPTRLLLGLTATLIHDELTTAYGQGVVPYRTVAYRESLDDYSQSGRHVSVITQQNIDAVKDLLNNDPHISTATILGIVYHISILINTQRD